MPGEMTLKQLAYIVAPAETHHFRKAAERAGVSQPSLSQQILGLETALRLDLVERGQRGAVLTPGGRDVLAQARKVLEEAQVLRAIAEDAREGASGTIRLGSTLVIAQRQSIEIDDCPQCRGVWLDPGELEKIIERSTGAMKSPNRNRDDGQDMHKPRRKRAESFLGELFDF